MQNIKHSFLCLFLRISNKYRGLNWSKLPTITLSRNNMTYIQNTQHFRGFKLTFADWSKFRLKEN
jgi:hypothetical protein